MTIKRRIWSVIAPILLLMLCITIFNLARNIIAIPHESAFWGLLAFTVLSSWVVLGLRSSLTVVSWALVVTLLITYGLFSYATRPGLMH
jgi:hypothetical protein